MKKLITTLLCAIVFIQVANAATYYVKTDGTDGANAGTSWSTAFATITYATSKAAAGDNIYVKAGNYTALSASVAGSSALTTKADVNYYGGFAGASDTETPATRATSDLDNNGITEPWEFTNATTLSFNATNNAYGLYITSNTAKRAFDGFTITGTLNVGQLSASTGGNNMVKINNFTTFQNNTLSGCTLSAAPNTATANMGYTKGALIYMGQPTTTTGGSNTVDNCLIENNTSTVTPTATQTQDVQQSPFVHIDASNTTGRNVLSNCVFRKNQITLEYKDWGGPSYNNPRGMLISMSIFGSSALIGQYNCIKNLLVHNNSATFNPKTGALATTNLGNGGLIYTYNTVQATYDTIVNCTVANNSMMRIGYAIRCGFSNATQPYHVIANNVLLDNKNNNGSGTISVQNLIYNQTLPLTGGLMLIANNFMNGGNGIVANGVSTAVVNNYIDLSSTNINAKGSYFTSPTANTLIGYSTDASVATSKWTIDNGSYLTGKGLSTLNARDKAGVTFTSIPTVGAYETTKPVITWAQSALNLLSNQSPVTLTAASSTVTPVSTPAASAISYSSDNSAAVSVNGNVLTVVGVGTANIIASQPANSYYNAATTVSKTVNVTQNGYRGAIISNGTFELGTDASSNVSWWQKTGATANFTYLIDNTSQITGSNSAKLTVTTAGTATQCAFFQYMTLPKPSTYTVTFKAKASTVCTIQGALVQSYNPFGWISGGSASFNLTTSTQTFSYDITTTSAIGLCKFAYYFGNVLTDIYLDDVTIVEKTPLTNANMCNGDFEATMNNAIYSPTNYTFNGLSSGTPDATANALYYGWSLLKLTASTAAMTATTETGVDKISGSQSIKLTSTGTATATSTDLQFAYVFAGVKDRQYNIYFKAKASAATTMGVMLQAWSYSASPTITYLTEQTINLTTAVQTFGFTTTNAFLQPDGRNVLQFLLGKLPNGVSVWIDDVVVQPVQATVVTPAITWTQSLTGLSVGSSPVSLTASSNYTPASSPAASAITYGSSNTAAITVSGSTLTVVGAGTSNITAYQPADATGNYSAASTVVQSVTIAKATPTITVTPVGTYIYNGSAQGPNAVTKGGSTGAVTYSYNGVNGTVYSAATRPTNAGSYTVTANVAADVNYSAASSSATAFTIDTASPTVTPTIGTYTYNGSSQGPNTATNTGTGTSYTYIYSGTGTSTPPTAAGDYTVTVTVAAHGNYSEASSSATAFTIGKATPTITPTVGTYTYNGSAQGPNAATNSGTGTSYTYIYSGTGTSTPPTAAGDYTVTVTVAAHGNYGEASSSATAFTIGTATPTVTPTVGTYTYTGNPQGPNAATNTGTGTSYTYIYSGTGTSTPPTAVGDYTVTVTVAAHGNYGEASSSATAFTINDAPNTVIVSTTNPTIASLGLNTASDVTITGSGSLIIDADKTVNSVTVAPGAKLDLGSSKTLTVKDLVIESGKLVTESPSVNLTKAMSIIPGGTVKLLKTLDANKWYFISFPCDVAINSIIQVSTTGDGTLNTLGAIDANWWIKYYDGAARVLNLGTTPNWVSLSAGGTLFANKGYIIGLGNALTGDHVLSFTLNENLVKTAESATTVPISNYGEGLVASNHVGWNLVGSPYLSKFDGSGVGAKYLTFHNGLIYEPKLKTAIGRNINPFEAFFVQCNTVGLNTTGTSLTFDTNSRQLTKSIVETDMSETLQLNITTSTGTDNTNLIMDNNESTAYQINQDLEKWITLGTVYPQVYTVLGGINYAYNALPMSNVVNLPVGFYTKTPGTATISAIATQAPSLSKLLLTDNSTSPATVTDLKISNYTFTAAAGTDNSRFTITAQRVPTENVVIGANALQLSIVNCQLSIKNLLPNSTVRVFDAIGRMVADRTVSNNSLEINLAAKGMYTVQIEAGGKNWVKKIVN